MSKDPKQTKKESRFSVLNRIANDLSDNLLKDEFIKKNIDDNGYLNEDGKKYLMEQLIKILSQGMVVNNGLPIINENSYGITKKQQTEKAIEYFDSILSKINTNDQDLWYGFISSILNLGSIKHSPFSLKLNDNIDSPNILSNVTWYISNNIPSKDAEIYDLDNKIPYNSKRNEKDVKAEYESIFKSIEDEQQEKQSKSDQKIGQLEYKVNEQGEIIKNGRKIVDDLQDENTALKGKLTDAQILRNEVDEVKSDIKQLLKKNKSDILNDVALTLAGNPDLKKNIRKIKGDLKASNPDYSDGDINYIISKALSENERYMKTVAANPDLFERDMSNDTIQKENEQFQSKLRQQNLRYILPKFIERREKLVENTLNPNLLKGAFAI